MEAHHRFYYYLTGDHRMEDIFEELKDNEMTFLKIVMGISDIKRAPLKLVSEPDFEFDPETVHLRYIGERTAGGTQIPSGEQHQI